MEEREIMTDTSSVSNYVLGAFTTPISDYNITIGEVIMKMNGDISWKGNKIEGDSEFKEAVIYMAKYLRSYNG